MAVSVAIGGDVGVFVAAGIGVLVATGGAIDVFVAAGVDVFIGVDEPRGLVGFVVGNPGTMQSINATG
jgi:hypothetical protein